MVDCRAAFTPHGCDGAVLEPAITSFVVALASCWINIDEDIAYEQHALPVFSSTLTDVKYFSVSTMII